MSEEPKEIILTRGQAALVDAEDFDFIGKWKWYAHKQGNTFYAVRMVKVDGKRKRVWMHRVLNQTPDDLETDHINGVGTDNRKSNLRSATRIQNNLNRAMQQNNTSGCRGVSWSKVMNKWHARIKTAAEYLHIGYFSDKTDAANAYKAKDLEFRQNEIRRKD